MGRELVLGLLNRNAKVVAIDKNESGLQETLELSGENRSSLKYLVVDVTDRKSVGELFNKIISEYGYVDGSINNAGIIQPFVKLNELSCEAIERIINVNLYGTVNSA